MRTPFVYELGEVNIGDIIVGHIHNVKLKVIDKTANGDGTYSYVCEKTEGFYKGELIEIESYMNYRRVN
jgi:hypothetical protein